MNTVRDELLKALAEAGTKLPSVRFGQLIANLTSLATGDDTAVWDIEDEELLAAARQQIEFLNREPTSADT